jgi:hypothetical protein
MSDVVTTEWEQSEQINEIAGALAKAQAEVKNAKKSADNPFFKSKYADLAEVTEACRAPLTKNGIAVIQGTVNREGRCGVRTMLAHSSGQWMACTALAQPKDNGPQAIGSVWTYLRRYSLAGMTGVATEDDDGEKAEGRSRDAKPPGSSWGKPANKPADPADPGEAIDEVTLHSLRSAALAKYPKGTEAKKWLKEYFGTDNPEKLTKFEAEKAIKLLAAA